MALGLCRELGWIGSGCPAAASRQKASVGTQGHVVLVASRLIAPGDKRVAMNASEWF